MTTWFRFLSVLIPFFLWVGVGLFAAPFAMPEKVDDLMANYCFDCHDDETRKGEVRLDNLATLALKDRLDLLNRVQEQIFIKEMPPRKKKTQPSDKERQQLFEWMSAELRKHNASKLEEKLRYPGYGNYLDHQKLFSGEIKDKPFSPSRRWLVSPRIFHERVMNVLRLTDHERRGFSTLQFDGVKNPFMLPERSGVRDYDVTTLDGGHLLVMLSNAKWIAGKQLFSARLKTPQKEDLLKALSAKDRWYPEVTPEAFERIVLKAELPTNEEMNAAVEEQFDCVLMRRPTKEELAKYVDLLRSSIALAGNSEGLRQMLFAVLLESDFLYRMELGGGEPDEFGRHKLTPQEGSLAIAYALGDRSPDPELTKAVEEGRFESKDDYRREVERLLADENYYKGPVDHKISGKNMRSHETSHPKIVRFFREFFGYPKAAKIFKDIERSDGYYQNPGRGTLGTPGFLIKEADRVVDWYLKKDKNVFENLLTTEEFFVYHDKDNETGRKIIAEWTQAYERLKDTEWKQNPEKVIEENLDYLKTKKSVRVSGAKSKREFMRHMHFWGETIGKGRTPFTTPSFAHGYTYNHSVFYSLPPTPNPFRYGGVENKNHKGLDDVEFWDYPVEQPFEISQRKGLLTHPAWLIAHSSNFHTDPIKRGRWIREKLLAGSVPDVPITVDAQVPEDPHKTLRGRVESVTGQAECRKCHERMNPLGFPFEVFDDFGRYRLEEPLEYEEQLLAKAKKKNGANLYKTKSVSTLGALRGTGDSKLDGEVSDAFDLIDRLAKSTRVRQSIIRHAFRFYMGRNEFMSDSQTLIDADQAYLRSGGSFKEVIISLLTSDSFRYRK